MAPPQTSQSTKPLTWASASRCWELRSPTRPLMLSVDAPISRSWCSQAPGFARQAQLFVTPQWERGHLTQPCPSWLSSPLGFCQGQLPRRTLTWSKEVTHPVSQSTDFNLGQQAPPSPPPPNPQPFSPLHPRGFYRFCVAVKGVEHKGHLGKFQGTPRSPSSKTGTFYKLGSTL